MIEYDSIQEYLESMCLDEMFCGVDEGVNEKTQRLYDTLSGNFEKFVPSTTVRSNNKPKWQNKQLNSLKNKRNKMHKQLCELRDQSISDANAIANREFLFLRAREDHDAYRKHMFSECWREQAVNLKRDPKSFWRHINSKRVTNSTPSMVSFNGKQASNDKDKADLFASFFQICLHKPRYGS